VDQSEEGRGREKHWPSRALVLLLVAGPCILLNNPVADAASNWAVHVAAGSKGESQASVLPTAPTGIAASCAAPTTAKTIKVTWNAVTHATTYSVYDSTTSAGGAYSLIASGVSTTSWTSGALTSGTNYWFEVVAVVGSNWAGVKSTASAESTINGTNPFCIQP
jgi:endoglucanase